jgi:hypothetical protein
MDAISPPPPPKRPEPPKPDIILEGMTRTMKEQPSGLIDWLMVLLLLK